VSKRRGRLNCRRWASHNNEKVTSLVVEVVSVMTALALNVCLLVKDEALLYAPETNKKFL
jgi:hypothetical protein